MFDLTLAKLSNCYLHIESIGDVILTTSASFQLLLICNISYYLQLITITGRTVQLVGKAFNCSGVDLKTKVRIN